MPPKARVTKDMVIDAAFEVARQTGAENISARTVSEKLNCSTQPVMYHFATIEALKKAAYAKSALRWKNPICSAFFFNPAFPPKTISWKW